jgi:hypothetical protein
MRLTWRDAFATLFVIAGLAFALSVTQGWSWPLMNGVRAGIIALGLAGVVACSVSGWAQDAQQSSSFYRSPFFITGAVVGVLLLGIGVVGLFVGTMAYLVWMMVAFALLWLITVVHRMVPAGVATKRPSAA